MSDTGSQWKRPTDIMRTHRLRKRPNNDIDCRLPGDRNGIKNDNAVRADNDISRKRKNPFRISSPSTRRQLDRRTSAGDARWAVAEKSQSSDEENVSPDSSASVIDSETEEHKLFSILNTAHEMLQPEESTKSQRSVIRKTLRDINGINQENSTSISALSQDEMGQSKSDDSTVTIAELGDESELDIFQGESLPWDWSLKIKARIVTQTSLLSGGSSASSAKATALGDFVRNVSLCDDNTGSLFCALQRSCNYWVHPSLPWFPEFPRIVPDSKIRKQIPLDVGLNGEIQTALYKSWLESFTSVYQQLKAGLCPYFYLCCHQFTVLFRAQTVGGQAQQIACLTPTTRGVREALKREGVEFTMPGQRRSNTMDLSCHSNGQTTFGPLQTSPNSSTADKGDVSGSDDENEGDSSITASNEGASLWLQEVGLDAKKFPTLEPKKVKIEREGYWQVDRRAESLVLCVGSEVQALFNFLINFRSCVAQTGPQAGIPPTILASTPFSGATLKSNKIEHSVAKLSTGVASQDSHVVDISGPLLPHHTLNVCAVLQQAVAEPCVVSLNTQEHSAPLNLSTAALPQCSEGSPKTQTSFESMEKLDVSSTDFSTEGIGDRRVSGDAVIQESTCEDLDSQDHTQSSTGTCLARQEKIGKTEVTKYTKALISLNKIWGNTLHKNVRNQLCSASGLKSGTALREVKCLPCGFAWSC